MKQLYYANGSLWVATPQLGTASTHGQKQKSAPLDIYTTDYSHQLQGLLVESLDIFVAHDEDCT